MSLEDPMRDLLSVVGLAALLLLSPDFAVAQSGKLAVLMPGAGGAVPIDFLVRNENRIRAAGIETVVTTSPGQAASLVRAEVEKKRKVVLVGMSRGARDVAQAIQAGARPTGVVFVSGGLNAARQILGSPAVLPATLVIHHRRDECDRTRPADAQSFAVWAGGKATLRWIDNNGPRAPNPCGPRGAHGFYLQDGPAVSAIIGFIRAR
jgi:hypothetical protein